MRLRPFVLPLLLLGAALGLSSCDTSDASSIKITLNQDLSGELLTSAVSVPPQPDASQNAIGGAAWQASGAIAMAKGSFPDITKLNIGGITFETHSPMGDPILRVTIPRGPDAKWPAAFTVPSKETRRAASKALDPNAKVSTLGDAIKIEVDVPGVVISAGSSSKARGVNSTFEETRGALTIPVEVATTPGEPIIWHITWKSPTVK